VQDGGGPIDAYHITGLSGGPLHRSMVVLLRRWFIEHERR